jgi:PAS domain S-box-containing protein
MDTISGGKTVFQYATEGVIVTDNRGIIKQVNPSAEKLFGYTAEELIDKPIEILIPRRFTKKHEGHRDGYSHNPKPRSMGIGRDLHGARKDGSEFPVEISLSPYTNEQGSFVIAFVIDISVRKAAEQELKDQRDELGKLNHDLDQKVKQRTLVLEEAVNELNKTKEELNETLKKEKELSDLKSRFVSMASHEFRTPLAGILSSLSLVEKYGELNDKEKQARHIERIKVSVNNLTDILNDILSISKIEEGKVVVNYENLNIKDQSNDIVRDLQVVAKEGQKIIYEHIGEEEVVFDKKILRHLLFNLISNAIKFSNEHGSVEVKTVVNKGKITVSVKDDGIGISEEDQKHLFERFFRGQNASSIQGTGLGLNIVAKYTEILKGSIECKSELEKGTTFIIKLPNNKKNG